MKQLLLILAIAFALPSFGQNDRKSPHDTVSSTHVTVTYGRPYKKGREIFGGLEKYGKVWRLGADEATTITFNSAVKFGTEVVKAGTYTLFAIPDENEWTIILNGVLGQWGAFSYEKNKGQDIAKLVVPVIKRQEVVEQLTISFGKDDTMVIDWDKTRVVIPMSFQ
jgi:hypothetical protein